MHPAFKPVTICSIEGENEHINIQSRMPPISPNVSIEASMKLPSSILLPPLGYDGYAAATSDSSTTLQTTDKKRVKFVPTIKLILIPSRSEYKIAGLNPLLWWTGNDFFGFQQSAHSELRLLSSYENIGMKEARRKLYQPDQNDSATEFWERNVGSSSNREKDEYDDFFAIGDDEATSPPPRNDNVKDQVDHEETTVTSRSPFHKVSSLALISSSLRHHDEAPTEEAATPPVPLFPKVSSLDGLAAAFRESETDDASPAWTPSARGQALLAKPTSPWTDENVLLLCVPVDKPAPLSSGPSYSWRSAMRQKSSSKSTLSSTTLAFCSTILVVAFVLVDRYCILSATM